MKKENYRDKQDRLDREYREIYSAWVDGLSEEDRMKLDENGLSTPHIDPRGVGGPELDEARLADPSEGHDSGNHKDASESITEQSKGCSEFPAEREGLQDSLRTLISLLFEGEDTALVLNLSAVALGVPFCTAERRAGVMGKPVEWVRDRADDILDQLNIESPVDASALSRVVGRLISTANAQLSIEVLALVSGICYQGVSQTSIAANHGVTRAAVSKRCVELADDLGLPPSRSMKSENARRAYSKAQHHHYGKLNKM